MTYESTRGSKEKVTFSQAVVAGLAPDGGLFVPCGDVRFGENELAEMAGLDYCGLAFKVMSRYAGDFTEDDLKDCEKKVQDLTDKMCADVDKMVADKEKEIMTV